MLMHAFSTPTAQTRQESIATILYRIVRGVAESLLECQKTLRRRARKYT